MLPRQKAPQNHGLRLHGPAPGAALPYTVAAGTGGLALLAGLFAGGWPWGAACGLLLGGLAVWAVLAAWKPDAASSNSMQPLEQGETAWEHRPDRETPPERLLFDATRPIPPLDPDLLARSSADRVARQIREDTKRFRQGAGAA